MSVSPFEPAKTSRRPYLRRSGASAAISRRQRSDVRDRNSPSLLKDDHDAKGQKRPEKGQQNLLHLQCGADQLRRPEAPRLEAAGKRVNEETEPFGRDDLQRRQG